MAVPLQKLTPKANASISDVGTIDSLVQSFGPYITGLECSQLQLLCALLQSNHRHACLRSNIVPLHTGTQLEDEDVVAKDVKNIDGRVVSPLATAEPCLRCTVGYHSWEGDNMLNTTIFSQQFEHANVCCSTTSMRAMHHTALMELTRYHASLLR